MIGNEGVKLRELEHETQCSIDLGGCFLEDTHNGGRKSLYLVIKGSERDLEHAVISIENRLVECVSPQNDRGRLLYFLASVNKQNFEVRKKTKSAPVLQRIPGNLQKKMWMTVFLYPKAMNDTQIGVFIGRRRSGLIGLEEETGCHIDSMTSPADTKRWHLFVTGSSASAVSACAKRIQGRISWAMSSNRK